MESIPGPPAVGASAERRTWRGRRVCLFDPATQLDAIHRAYFDEVGIGAGKFLYLTGFRTAAAWSGQLGETDYFPRRTEALAALAELGLGHFVVREDDPRRAKAVLTSKDSIEVEGLRARGSRQAHPYCHFTRGVLAGFWSFLARGSERVPADLVCWERECIATGATRCTFEIGSARELRDRGLIAPDEGETVRWELIELDKNLKSSRQRLSSLETELAQRQLAYEALLDNMNDMLLVLDDQKRIVFFNSRFLEATGLTMEEARGSTPLERIVPEDRAAVEAIYDELLSGKRNQARYSFRVSRPAGVVYMESSARRVVLPTGDVTIETLGRDVTERSRAQAELEAANASLVRKQAIADNDLRMAKLVHESLLPRPVSIPRLDVDVKYVPAERVGGDYCHIQFPNPRTCVLTLCDVSGHGMASALLAARVSSHVRQFCASPIDPLAITVELNRFLRRNFADTGFFVTFLALTIDLETFELDFCGAGHPGPLLFRRREHRVEALASQNLPIGIVDDFLREPSLTRTRIEPGDRILLYTDGVSETLNSDSVPLRAEGIERWLLASRDRPLFQLGDWLLEQVSAFGAGPPHDDMTVLLVEAKN